MYWDQGSTATNTTISGYRIHQKEGLSGEVHLHSLADDGNKMSSCLILPTPQSIPLTELAVLIEFLLLGLTAAHIPIPLLNKGHVLACLHLTVDLLKVRKFETDVPTVVAGPMAVDQLGDAVVCDSLGQREQQALMLLECTQKVVDTRFTYFELTGNLGSSQLQDIVLYDDVFVV